MVRTGFSRLWIGTKRKTYVNLVMELLDCIEYREGCEQAKHRSCKVRTSELESQTQTNKIRGLSPRVNYTDRATATR
jgi:hypothetical protein